MIYRKVKTNLSRTLSSIEQDKATSDDYVKCISGRSADSSLYSSGARA